MTELVSSPQTRAYVIHPDIRASDKRRAAEDSLIEAKSLAWALPHLEVLGGTVVSLPKAHPGTLFGSGKINALRAQFEAEDVELVLIDGPVTPVQQRNLEKAWNVKLLDRTGLILEIFSDRARTREGVLQVEMAALSYQRTRLVRAWTHLERQRGGLGFVGGPGETQIEADRRAIDKQLTRLKRQLAKVVKTRELHRSARAKVPYPIVALVGYTNAGKSTLFNRITGSDVFAKDMLFATLDPTMRAVQLPDGTDIILSDTVGFISDLPTELVAAFRATLEEVTTADLVVHVRDISHPDTETQHTDVLTILESLGISEEHPVIALWNKADQLTEDQSVIAHNTASRRQDVHLVSAITGDGIADFLANVVHKVIPPKSHTVLSLDFGAGKARAWLYEQNVVQSEASTDAGLSIEVVWTERQAALFQRQFAEPTV